MKRKDGEVTVATLFAIWYRQLQYLAAMEHRQLQKRANTSLGATAQTSLAPPPRPAWRQRQAPIGAAASADWRHTGASLASFVAVSANRRRKTSQTDADDSACILASRGTP